MKLKYFMRGLGIGIIFGAIVMLVATGTSDKEKMSDEEVIKRAKKLGMVMATDTDADTETETTTEAVTVIEKETTTEAAAATDKETTTEAATTTEKETTTETATTTEEVTTTEAATTEEKKTYTEATISVTRGMGSTEVAGLLQKAEIIKDAEDFDNYLVNQGISNKIQINTFKLNSNMTYEEIAKIITTPKND